jgi:hypothetical protein
MLRRRMQAFMLATCGAAAIGCSEKPLPQTLVWEPIPLSFKAAIRGVAALSPDEAVAVGYTFPEFLLLAQPVALQRSGGYWLSTPVPGHRDVSFQLHDCARSDDGLVWACGGILPSLDDPFSALPAVYRYDGEWTEVGLDSLLGVNGVLLHGIAAWGAGERLEVRAAGERADQTGVVLQYRNGNWTNMVLPSPAPGASWGLVSVARAVDGTWYAAGPRNDAPGGMVFADRGAGWEIVPGPPVPGLHFTDVAVDPHTNTAWFTANETLGDSLEGALFALRSGTFVHTPIARASGGGYRLFAIDFDAQGHGWVGGGRTLRDPFLAGNLNGSWEEMLTESALGGEFPGEAALEGGGEVVSVSVATADRAYAVGQQEVVEAEGQTELNPRIIELFPKPRGEIDKPRGPLQP